MGGACGALPAQGVDSTAGSNEALEAGRSLARQFGCIVGISGAVDLVSGPLQVLLHCNGAFSRIAGAAASAGRGG